MDQLSSSQPCILIVDDEEKIASLLKAVLEQKYPQVHLAIRAQQATEMISNSYFDLVVTDLKLPDGSGIDLLRHTKHRDNLAEVIIITGYASLDTATSAVNLGASSYLVKPVSLPNFAAQVDRALANREFHLKSKHLMDHYQDTNAVALEHLRNMSAIYELSRKLTHSLDVPEIMRTTLEELGKKMHSSTCAIGVDIFGSAEIFATSSAGLCDAAIKQLILAHWDNAFAALDHTEFSRERVLFSVYGNGKWAEPSNATSLPPTSAMTTPITIPLIVMGRTIGSLLVFRAEQTPVTTGECQFLHVFSSLVAPLVENGFVHRRTQSQAATDGLTGISNHRAFQEMLSREIARADRDRSTFGLLIVDIDDFKKVNDTYGHLVGDSILCELSGRVSETIREGDMFARYGGEEFTLILPSTSLDGCYTLAERIRSAVASRPFQFSGVDIPCTVSLGLSIYDGKNPRKKETLVRDADDGLYASKNCGKNRVTMR